MSNEFEKLNNYWVWFTDMNDSEPVGHSLYYGYIDEESAANQALQDADHNFQYIYVVNENHVKTFELGLKAI